MILVYFNNRTKSTFVALKKCNVHPSKDLKGVKTNNKLYLELVDAILSLPV